MRVPIKFSNLRKDEEKVRLGSKRKTQPPFNFRASFST